MNILKVSDAFCYICRGVLIEPVTVPCLHVFCYACFEQSMQETSYSCPLCRRRISNWVRTAKKTDKLINVELWKKIKEQFKEQVHSKLRGEDDGLDERLQKECPAPLSICNPGEVAKEFSKLMNDFQAEQERLQAAEELASRELINKLTEEEERQLEATERDNIIKIQKDEELARKLQEEINKEVQTSSSQPEKTKHTVGPMDNFLKGKKNGVRLQSQEKFTTRSTSSDSTDSIQSEMHHFKPIKVVPRTPPKRYPDGKVLEIAVTKVKPLKLLNSRRDAFDGTKKLTESKKIHSPYSAFIGKVMTCPSTEESPRKRMRACQDELDVLKEITLGENSDSNSMGAADLQGEKKKRISPKSSHILKKNVQNSFMLPPKLFHFESAKEESENSDLPQFETQDYLNPEPGLEAELIEEQRRIEQLILQEKADRELALKLSKEWEGRYELRKKTNQKQVTVKRKAKMHENKKLQQTLIETLVTAKTRK